MSTFKFTIKSFIIPFFVGIAAILMVSCGTQNQAYNRNDGIYAAGSNTNQYAGNEDSSKSNYYQQYFQTKSMSYQDAQSEEDVIFTDIDAYSTTERLDDDGNIIIEENYYDDGEYGPWGSNIDNTVVNIYHYGNYGFWRPPYYGYGGYYGGGYYGPSWRMGYGWGYPYHYGYYGFYYPYYYGYNHGYSYPFYYNSSYNSGYNVAQNRGRRNTDYNRTGVRGRTNNSSVRNNSSYSRSESGRRVNRNNVRANTNTGRNNSTVRDSRSNTIRNNNSGTIRNNRVNTNSRNNNVRQNQNTRNINSNSNTRNIRSNSNTRTNRNMSTPRSAPRSSGGVRSSGSSIRSSGGATRSGGGGRSSGGRGRG